MLFKRWGKSAEEKVKSSVKSKLEGFKPSRTKEGQNIGLIEMLYFAVVIIVTFILLGILKGDSWGALIILFGAVAALSHHVRAAAIPPIYDVIAEKMGWPCFKDSQRIELDARDGKERAQEQPASTQKSELAAVVPAADATRAEVVAVPAEDSRVSEILTHFVKLEPETQTSKALAIVGFLRGVLSHPFFDLIDAVEDQKKPERAQEVLLLLAKQKGIVL